MFTQTQETIDTILEQARALDLDKADFYGQPESFTFDKNANMVVPGTLFGGVPPMPMSEWATRQLYQKLGPAVFGKGSNKSLPNDYLTALLPDRRATLLNDHVKTLPVGSDGWFVRSYKGEIRAVLSKGYTNIGNTELVEIAEEVVRQNPSSEFSLVRPNLTPDTLHLKMIWKNVNPNPDRKDGGWGIGVYIGNGEIGNRRLSVFPMLQRHSCTNSIIVESERGVEFIHRGSRDSKMAILKAIIAELFPIAADALNKMIKADSEKIPQFTDVLSGLAKQYGWSDVVTTNVAVGTEGRDTRAGLINGITFAAHSSNLSQDDQADMEILGGRILLASDSVFHQAVQAAKGK
jgi:hypothetical protein